MQELLIIGLDGGATKVNGWTLSYDQNFENFKTGKHNVQKSYEVYQEFSPEFTPVPIPRQLKENRVPYSLNGEEIRQGKAYMKACLDVLLELISHNPDKKIIVGLGMPGLKTQDERGISVLANGPRMPEYASFIESGLQKENKALWKPIARLGSDADYCGIGEQYAEKGMFSNYNNAYYLGGGTGVADAIKLDGQLITFDSIRPWMAKSWEMKTESGLSLEKYTSARGIQIIYSLHSKISLEELDSKKIFGPQILENALADDSFAIQTMDTISSHLALLIYERIHTLYFGWSGHFEFLNPERKIETKAHPFIGTLFEKIIFGQRLGDLLELSKTTDFLWNQILDNLGKLIQKNGTKALTNHYVEDGRFRESILGISKLREAPVIGAGIDAFLHYKNHLKC